MFFLSVLINLTLAGAVPTHGWMQDNVGFEAKDICEETILPRSLEVHHLVHEWTDGLGEVEDIKCLTEPEWIELNRELGHKMPEKKLNNSQT
jgi:hypothetical protein